MTGVMVHDGSGCGLYGNGSSFFIHNWDGQQRARMSGIHFFMLIPFSFLEQCMEYWHWLVRLIGIILLDFQIYKSLVAILTHSLINHHETGLNESLLLTIEIFKAA